MSYFFTLLPGIEANDSKKINTQIENFHFVWRFFKVYVRKTKSFTNLQILGTYIDAVNNVSCLLESLKQYLKRKQLPFGWETI